MKFAPLFRLGLIVLSALFLWGCSAESKRARMLERASGYYKAKDFEKARIEYQNVLQSDPNNITANERLAQIWLERGSTLRAAGFLSRLKDIAPGNLQARLQLGQIHLDLGNAPEARREATLVIERSSSFPEALTLLTDSVRNPDDYRAAELLLERAGDKNSVHYLVATGDLARLKGDRAAAKAAYQKALTREPNSAAACLAMATMLASESNPQATELFKKAADNATLMSNAKVKYASHLAATKLPEAVAYLNELVKQNPDYLPAYRALTQIAISEKKFDEADARIKTIFAKDPMDFEARILRARMWQAQGDPKKAIEDLEKFGKEFPGLGVEKYQLGLAYLQANDQLNAVKALQEAITRNPDNVDGALIYAQLLMRNGAPQPAAAALADIITKRPHILTAYPLMIDALRAMGRLDQAEPVLKQGLAIAPNNPQFHQLAGLVALQLKKPEDARKSFEKALEIAPDFVQASAELVALDIRENKVPAAAARTKALLAKNPNAPVLRLLDAQVLLAEKKWDAGEAALAKMLEMDAKPPAIYGLLTEALAARKSEPATAGRLEKLLAAHPKDELLALAGGQFYSLIKDYPKARDVYEKHLAAKSDSTAVLNNLANLYDEQLKQPDRALELARKARATDSKSPVLADTLGWILYRRKEYKESLPLIEEAARGLASNPEVQYHLGMVQSASGNKDAAIAALKLAANAPQEFTGKAEAKQELAKLEPKAP